MKALVALLAVLSVALAISCGGGEDDGTPPTQNGLPTTTENGPTVRVTDAVPTPTEPTKAGLFFPKQVLTEDDPSDPDVKHVYVTLGITNVTSEPLDFGVFAEAIGRFNYPDEAAQLRVGEYLYPGKHNSNSHIGITEVSAVFSILPGFSAGFYAGDDYDGGGEWGNANGLLAPYIFGYEYDVPSTVTGEMSLEFDDGSRLKLSELPTHELPTELPGLTFLDLGTTANFEFGTQADGKGLRVSLESLVPAASSDFSRAGYKLYYLNGTAVNESQGYSVSGPANTSLGSPGGSYIIADDGGIYLPFAEIKANIPTGEISLPLSGLSMSNPGLCGALPISYCEPAWFDELAPGKAFQFQVGVILGDSVRSARLFVGPDEIVNLELPN